MDLKTYEITPERFFKGRKVKSLNRLTNGWASMPAGTVFTIERKRGGFTLTSDECPSCGIRMSISKVRPSEVDLADQASLPTELQHCPDCLSDKKVFCPRDVDAECLICKKKFCGAHIGQHLKEVHCVSLNLDHCREG